MNWLKSIEEIGNKVGILSCLLVFWMYMQITDLEKRVENLDQTAKDLAEVKQHVASMDAKLEIILADFVSKQHSAKSSP